MNNGTKALQAWFMSLLLKQYIQYIKLFFFFWSSGEGDSGFKSEIYEVSRQSSLQTLKPEH